ncbi:diguanylate cyclase domain-containing protein [uncultured Pseudokineococcus sp.]|uniref:diguanylate cyclase domain-containing protein n=1 Tax=uncultured Pseudokineococcus sp. TaxID=1642928 RepID=UPI002631BE7E|nr:diguanylate cyclase [uncultured Pseudokineococcus sp.]
MLPRPRPRPRPPGGSAFALVADRDVQRSTKPLLEAVSRHLEAQALTSGPTTVLLAALQHSRYFGARTAARYRRLASSAALVAVLGEGMAVHPTERVRGALLEAGDPLLEEWVVAVVNPHFTAALVAREVHGSGGRADESPEVTTGGPGRRAAGPDAERVFEYVITYERELVLEVAARLLTRVTHGPDGDPRSMASAVVGPVTDTTVAADTGGPDYRRAFTEAPVGMALVAPEGTVVRANRELELLLSRPAERLVGHDLPELARHDDAAALRAACRSAARAGRTALEVRFTRPDGSVVPTTVALAPLGGGADEGTHLVLHVEDAGPRKALEAELSHRALHDPLTGLANRTLFRDRLAHALARARRAGDDTSVLFLDLDGFKAVNDEHGHHVGDAVLVQTAHRLQENLRPGDTAARWGGDEFTVLCEGVGAPAGAAVAARLVAALAQPLRVEGHVLVPGCSVGLASASELDDPLGEEELLRRADAAMYASKSARRP